MSAIDTVHTSANGSDANAEPRPDIALQVVTLDQFVAVDEPGADALLGADGESALVPEGGDVMVYGDGGAGKTTLVVDFAFHLAAGDPWLGIPVARPIKFLVIENEGPRPHFRTKLRRKRAAWAGGAVADRITLLEEPWAKLDLRYEDHRQALADAIQAGQVDVVILGPVTAAGMLEAGTIQQVRDFMRLANDVRARAGRTVTFFLIHHEGKGGSVSGAWEGVGDTLFHLQGQGHGRTRLFIQKARWSSAHHATALQLVWAPGESFDLGDPERDDDTIADEILQAALTNGGTPWTAIEKLVPGKSGRKREIRDRLLTGGRLINLGSNTRLKLWNADDPALPATLDTSRPGWDDSGTAPAAAPGNERHESHRPSSQLYRDEDEDDSLASPVTTAPQDEQP